MVRSLCSLCCRQKMLIDLPLINSTMDFTCDLAAFVWGGVESNYLIFGVSLAINKILPSFDWEMVLGGIGTVYLNVLNLLH